MRERPYVVAARVNETEHYILLAAARLAEQPISTFLRENGLIAAHERLGINGNRKARAASSWLEKELESEAHGTRR